MLCKLTHMKLNILPASLFELLSLQQTYMISAFYHRYWKNFTKVYEWKCLIYHVLG